ncbi:hypothetical protein H072_3520 [Dactylellina haptotyla CBS 200.50]|uniref:Uncharacterized protein n=1 Tax=Dactylellina haptotyla (strain CBS 200.50) TaxID=1284197 RepID=S8C485_DACHA|nr:hypothetical protein H072_3520 [Dactylellina haptotyla CBS 200.50]
MADTESTQESSKSTTADSLKLGPKSIEILAVVCHYLDECRNRKKLFRQVEKTTGGTLGTKSEKQVKKPKGVQEGDGNKEQSKKRGRPPKGVRKVEEGGEKAGKVKPDNKKAKPASKKAKVEDKEGDGRDENDENLKNSNEEGLENGDMVAADQKTKEQEEDGEDTAAVSGEH